MKAPKFSPTLHAHSDWLLIASSTASIHAATHGHAALRLGLRCDLSLVVTSDRDAGACCVAEMGVTLQVALGSWGWAMQKTTQYRSASRPPRLAVRSIMRPF